MIFGKATVVIVMDMTKIVMRISVISLTTLYRSPLSAMKTIGPHVSSVVTIVTYSRLMVVS